MIKFGILMAESWAKSQLKCKKEDIGCVYFNEKIYEIDGKQVIITKITGELKNLPAGKHGFHIHESAGDCINCDTMGGHYNPFGRDHGDISNPERHVGDLGNIIADANGKCKIDLTSYLIRLTGQFSVIGRGLIIHAGEDDLGLGTFKDSKTTGHSGARICCAAIVPISFTETKVDEWFSNS